MSKLLGLVKGAQLSMVLNNRLSQQSGCATDVNFNDAYNRTRPVTEMIVNAETISTGHPGRCE